MCNYWTQPNKHVPTRIKFVPESITNGPNKIFFGLSKQHRPTRTILGSTQQQAGQICFMTQTIRHSWHATSDATSDYIQHGKAA
jgi:hypothetical protein